MKKVWKALITVLLAFAVVLAVTACNGDPEEPKDPGIEQPGENGSGGGQNGGEEQGDTETPGGTTQGGTATPPAGGEEGGTPSTPTPPVALETLSFGTYPQSEVTDGALSEALTALAGDPEGNAGAWHNFAEEENKATVRYADVEHGGNRYRGIYISAYRTSYQYQNGYDLYTVYWFRYDPVVWTVLEENDGQTLLFSNSILDALAYGTGANAAYGTSALRAWLNATFLQTAFSQAELSRIVTSTVDNSGTSTGHPNNPDAGQNTQDKVFLLSYLDLTNTVYGFSGSFRMEDNARRRESSDYAKSLGLWEGYWWTRSPYFTADQGVRAYLVHPVGYIGSNLINEPFYGVCPAIRIIR